ncbi:MAG: hypothetical protein K0U34_01260, partial [Alphaproteobacteria bacterium]|nr:hypothetical protein [Alphaproteobacteria bacterium]
MALRSASLLTSAALHGSLAVFVIAPWVGGNALEAGTGNDQFLAEDGIAIEGVGFGTSMVTTEAVEETPMEMSAARPEIEEVIALEVEEPPPEEPLEALPEDTKVLTSNSETAPALEAEPERQDEVVEQEKPQEAQVATLEQNYQEAIKEQQQAGAKQLGGAAKKTAMRAYKGSLHRRIRRRSIAGRG